MTPIADLLICLRFLSRFPVPTTRRECELGSNGFAAAAAMAPLAGVVIALVPAAMLLGATAVHLPPGVAAPLAVASLVVATGALHDDALADCADGFGGGRTRARKLEIMRDSRIGAFGAAAIALSLYIRAASLTAATVRGTVAGLAALVLAAALSRASCLAPLVLLPPMRLEGAGFAAARPSLRSVTMACGTACCVAALTALATGITRPALAVAVTIMLALATCAVARQQIGGQTGDVAGAAQQIAEIGVLLVFAAS